MRQYKRYSSYTKEQVEKAVKNSLSWREVIKYLNPDAKGYRGSESNMKKTAVKFGIDFSHFRGLYFNLGKKLGPKRPIEDYFNGVPINSDTLKKRLFREGIKEKRCECCKNTHWLDMEISLELHHKDKNPNNNKLENLEITCANCHSYRHKKDKEKLKAEFKEKHGCEVEKVKYKQKYRARKRSRECLICKNPSINKYCSYECSHKASRKVNKPTKEELEKLVWEKSSVEISKQLGLKSSTMVGRWCKEYGISKPPRGYWEKIYHGNMAKQQDALDLDSSGETRGDGTSSIATNLNML